MRATLGLPKAKDVKAAKVKAAKAANPKASTKQIAKEAGVDPKTAAAALEEKREIPGDPNVAKPEPKAKLTPAARHIEEYAARVASFMPGQPANLALMIKRQAALSAMDAATLTQDQRSLLVSIERMRDGLAQDLAECAKWADADANAPKPAKAAKQNTAKKLAALGGDLLQIFAPAIERGPE